MTQLLYALGIAALIVGLVIAAMCFFFWVIDFFIDEPRTSFAISFLLTFVWGVVYIVLRLSQ